MIKPSMVLLATVLTAPFGLAIHEDLTTEKPDLSEIEDIKADLDLYADDYFDDELPTLELDTRDEFDEIEADEAAPITASTLTQVFGERAADLGPLFSGIQFGMSRAQVYDAASDHLRNALVADGGEFHRVNINVKYEAKEGVRMSSVRVEIPDIDGSAGEFLRERWGAPTTTGDGDPAIWYNANTGMRAVQFDDVPGTLTVSLSRAMPPENLFSADPKAVFAFEKQPLLGTTLDDLRKTYPGIAVDEDYGEYAIIDLPVMSVDPTGLSLTKVTLTMANEKVGLAELLVGCGAQCARVKTAFETKLGAPTGHDPASNTYTYGESPKVAITYPATGESGVIEIAVSRE